MKIKRFALAAIGCLTALSLAAFVACGDGDEEGGGNGSLTKAQLGEWTVDRTAPAAFDVDESKGTVTVTTDPSAANGEDGYNYNAYQGKAASVTMEASDAWEMTTSLAVTDEMIEGRVSTSVWLDVSLADGTSVDWAIIHFGKAVSKDGTVAAEAGWSYWNSDSESGGWVEADGIAAEAGTHELSVAFADGKITVTIGGEEAASYALQADGAAVAECKVSRVIVQAYCFGSAEEDAYSAVWGIPSVSYAAEGGAQE